MNPFTESARQWAQHGLPQWLVVTLWAGLYMGIVFACAVVALRGMA